MFPEALKKRKKDIVSVIMSDKYRAYEKMLVIYYAYYNKRPNFSFVHFLEWCELPNNIDHISLRNIINMYDNNKRWDVLRLINYDHFNDRLCNLPKYL
jgi:hypothetical protein